MEDKLKDILKKHAAFAELTDFERTQLVEWCADEEEFQSLKQLFQQVDVWSDQNTDETNTKMRLDHLFAIQYAGKQPPSGGREIRFTKNRFSRIATWTSISAVAATLVLTWFMYQPNKEVSLAKNDVKKPTQEKKIQPEIQEDTKLNGDLSIPTPIEVESSNEKISQEIASTEVTLPELSERAADVETMAAPTVAWSNSLANGNALTLSASPLGSASTTYSWTSDNLSEVGIISSKIVSKGKISSRKIQADAFTSFSVKSMPEMLDVIVSAY
jgi:hypothetical protein